MLGAGIGVVGGRWAGFGLTFKVAQGLFGGWCHDRALAVYLFLWQQFQTETHARLRTQRHYAEALGLAVGSVLEELHLVEVVNTDVVDSIRYILIRCPLVDVFLLINTTTCLKVYYLPMLNCLHTAGVFCQKN